MLSVLIGCYEHISLIAHVFSANQVSVAGFAPGGPDEDLSALPALSRRFPDMRLYDSVRAMLLDIKPDIAGVSPRIDRITEVACQLLDRQIHCLCEKPLAINRDQLQALAAASAASRARLACLLPMRYEPAYYTLHKHVQAGSIGDPILVAVQKSYQLGNRPAYFRSLDHYGGILPYIGSHTLDLTCFVTGKHFRTFSGWTTTQHNKGNQEMESAAALQFTFHEGGGGVNTLDYFRPLTAAGWADNRMRVVGSRGILETDGSQVSLFCEHHDTRQLPLELPGPAFADFIQDIRSGSDRGLIWPRNGLYTARMALLAKQAASSGQTVCTEDIP